MPLVDRKSGPLGEAVPVSSWPGLLCLWKRMALEPGGTKFRTAAFPSLRQARERGPVPEAKRINSGPALLGNAPDNRAKAKIKRTATQARIEWRSLRRSEGRGGIGECFLARAF